MALKPAVPAATGYVVPAMGDVDLDYSGLVAKKAELVDALNVLRQQKRKAEIDFQTAEAAAPRVTASVARLIGDARIDELVEKRRQLVEMGRSVIDHETAITLLDGKIAAAATRASRLVIAAARPEFGRRVAKLVVALDAAEIARDSIEQFRADIEAEGVDTGALSGDFHFLGDYSPRTGESFQPRRVRRWAMEAGYVN